MKITKQLSDNEFVVWIDPPQMNKKTHVVVAHDYVNIFGTNMLSTDHDLCKVSMKGPLAWCGNIVQYDSNIQIPIDKFALAILPMLNNHEYCKPEHASNYIDTDSIVSYYKDDVKMVVVFVEGEPPLEMTESMYKKLRGID